MLKYTTDIAAGYASSFGVFQEYYQTHTPFEGSGNIAIIGTCATVSIRGTLESRYILTMSRVSRIS